MLPLCVAACGSLPHSAAAEPLQVFRCDLKRLGFGSGDQSPRVRSLSPVVPLFAL